MTATHLKTKGMRRVLDLLSGVLVEGNAAYPRLDRRALLRLELQITPLFHDELPFGAAPGGHRRRSNRERLRFVASRRRASRTRSHRPSIPRVRVRSVSRARGRPARLRRRAPARRAAAAWRVACCAREGRSILTANRTHLRKRRRDREMERRKCNGAPNGRVGILHRAKPQRAVLLLGVQGRGGRRRAPYDGHVDMRCLRQQPLPLQADRLRNDTRAAMNADWEQVPV